MKIAREPGLAIEQALKRVRSSVHEATRNQQTPWESSSLTADFHFFPGAAAPSAERTPPSTAVRPASAVAGEAAAGSTRARAAVKSAESWRRDFRSRQPAEAYALVIEEGTPEAFEAYLAVYATPPYAPRVRSLLDRQREMIAWYRAVTVNTAASFQAFLAAYPNSDLGVTARRLMERAGNRLLASLAPVAATCPCGAPTAPAREPREKKAKSPPKEKQASRPTREKKRGKRDRDFVSDEEVGRGAPPRPVGVATPSGPPVSIGIGIPIGRGGGGPPGRPGPQRPDVERPAPDGWAPVLRRSIWVGR